MHLTTWCALLSIYEEMSLSIRYFVLHIKYVILASVLPDNRYHIRCIVGESADQVDKEDVWAHKHFYLLPALPFSIVITVSVLEIIHRNGSVHRVAIVTSSYLSVRYQWKEASEHIVWHKKIAQRKDLKTVKFLWSQLFCFHPQYTS